MRFGDLLRFAAKALSERRLRAALTIIGIVIGPATIVSLVGATQGFSDATTERLNSLGVTTLFVSPVGRGFTLDYRSVAEVRSLAGVSYVLPYQQLSGQVVQGGQSLSVSIVATDLSQISKVLPTISLATGALPGANDQVGAVIGSSIANPGIQGPTNLSVGQVVVVSSLSRSFLAFSPGGASSAATQAQRSFVVTGILGKFGQGFGINPDQTVFITLAAGQAILHSQTYTGLMVVASSTSTVDQVTSELQQLFGQNVRIVSISSLLSSVQAITQNTSTLLIAIAGTSVLVAFIGILTTMLTSVIERTEEIGVLKALGSTSRSILSIFLAEAVITGLIGGVIGAAAGSALSYVVISLLGGSARFVGGAGGAAGARGFGGGIPSAAQASSASALSITPVISPEIIVLAILLATAVGALGGLLPAWRASRMTPVEALRRS